MLFTATFNHCVHVQLQNLLAPTGGNLTQPPVKCELRSQFSLFNPL